MGSAPVFPINHLLVNRIVPRATPRAIVTTASWIPRMRNAGTPTMRPRIVAPIAPKIGEIGNGIPVSKAIFPNMNPAIPAKTA